MDGRFDPSVVRAVLFDVDGTLYRQRPLRWCMARILLGRALVAPVRTWRDARALAVFRRVREELRTSSSGDLEAEQYRAAATRAGVEVDAMRAVVGAWIHERPLRELERYRRAGLVELLARLAARDVRIGAFSDYPVDAKLAALGVAESFELMLDATDPAVGVFKPEPRGFLVAAERFRLSPKQMLYVGDRVEVDGAGAAAAGMPCVLVDGDESFDALTAAFGG